MATNISFFDQNLMSASFTACLTYEGSAGLPYDNIPLTEEPVYVLGNTYSALYDREELLQDISSRIWITYRKGFSPIGGLGPQTDAGWGCMLRCGQMILAQALVRRHLPPDWRWSPTTPKPAKYLDLLRLFSDSKSSYYSIHQIASMGMSEGKNVGEWFGPNTIAQVLKKLSVYDDWSCLSIHVALDNTIIMDDIKHMCNSCPSTPDDPVVSRVQIPGKPPTNSRNSQKSGHNKNGLVYNSTSPDPAGDGSSSSWRPLVLIIPLRLGLCEINCVYTDSLKVCFQLKQCIGIIGGKPNHAHYFIGCVGDELIYLDPHTVQPVVQPDQLAADDSSYHCKQPSRMKITSLDPSVAVGFYCHTEADFDDLCSHLITRIVRPNKTPIFEVHQVRPKHWPPFEPYPDTSGTHSEYAYVEERHYDTDEEYELL